MAISIKFNLHLGGAKKGIKTISLIVENGDSNGVDFYIMFDIKICSEIRSDVQSRKS